ncbi:MAG: hypothetical protein WA843_04290 [Candidatus Saccharimonadales bacterium]
MKKLDMRGVAHDVIIIAFVAIFAIAGVAYLVASHADSCSPVSGDRPNVNSSTQQDTPTISGTDCPVSDVITPTVTLSPSPATVSAGAASTLAWRSANATTCVASGAWSGTKATSGSISTGPLSATTTYSLKCTGAGGSATSTATVTVTAAPVPAKLTATCSITNVPQNPRYNQIIHPLLTITNTGNQSFTPRIQNNSVVYSSIKGSAVKTAQAQTLPTLKAGQIYHQALTQSSVPYRKLGVSSGFYSISTTASSAAGSPQFSCLATFNLPIQPSTSIKSN